MSKSGLSQGVYVELDSLIDARLGVLLKAGYNFEEIISSGYHERQSDEFFDLSIEDFKKLYQERDVEALSYGRVTNLIYVLKNILRDYVQLIGSSPIYNEVKLYLNTYPYQLSAYEEEQMVLCVKSWIDYLVPIEVIHMSPEHLTVFWVNEHIDTMLMYDYNEWLNAQQANFNKRQLTEVKVLSPAIYHIKVPTDEEVKNIIKDIRSHPVSNFFEATEILAMPLVSLNLIDVAHFSILDPKTQYQTIQAPAS